MLEKKALNLIIDSGKISEVEPTEKTDTPDGDNGE
jgi:hypothetical protein